MYYLFETKEMKCNKSENMKLFKNLHIVWLLATADFLLEHDTGDCSREKRALYIHVVANLEMQFYSALRQTT